MLNKNDTVVLTIEDLTSEGLGIGHAEGMAIFVKDTVIGDEVEAGITKVKKTYAFARVVKVLKESPDRVTPPCPCAKSCGGCQVQMMDYKAQLAFKQNKVYADLTRIGTFAPEDVPMQDIIGMEEPWRYRNKSQFPIGTDADGNLIAGFYAGRTHRIIPSEDCLIGDEKNQEILDIVLGWMKENRIRPYDEVTGKGVVRHVMTRVGRKSGQRMTVLVANVKKAQMDKWLPNREALIEKLQQVPGMSSIVLNLNTEKTNVILGRENITLAGESSIEDSIGDVRYQISPLSFYQINPEQTQKLYGKALEYAELTGEEMVWDLYCGIGTISLFLAQKAKKVCGVEIVPQAIEDAKNNAKRNGFANADFFVGKAEDVLPEKYKNEGIKADVIVVDPPRKGCEKSVLDTMLAMAPQRIVYVSCDPATLARDLKILCEKDYKLTKVQPVDMFPHSVHVETVVLLSRTSGINDK